LILLGGGLLYVALFWLVRRVWVTHVASEKSLTERNRELSLVNSRLETVAHLNRAVLSSLESGKLFALVVESAVKILPGVSLAQLWLLEEETETLSLAAEAGEPIARPTHTRLHLRNSLIGWIATSGKPHPCLDVLQDPHWRNVEWARREGIVSHAGVSVRSETRPLGVLSVLTRQPHDFTLDELELLTSLAGSAAIAMENARLFAEVQRGRAEWQDTFDAIDDPVILVGPGYEIVRVNRAGAAFVGMTPRELIGRSCCQLFCEQGEPRPDCPVAEVLRSGRSASVEVVDGRAAQVRAYPISGEADKVQAVVEHRRDITEMKESEERLLQVEKLRALGELAGGVAHDFNNVLAVVMGRADLLAASLDRGRLDTEEVVRRSVGIIKQAACDGAAIARRIRDFARFERARNLVPLDLNVVIREAVEFTRTRWAGESQARGIEVAVDLRLAEGLPVEGDPAELREVLTNMILNAVDAMPRGGTITLRSWLEGSQVCFAVTDTGIGMTEKVRQRVFDPFFTTKGMKGTGLGLSVAYGIIRRHGGEIRVESAPGRGSTFAVSLPVAGSPVAAVPEPPPEVVRGARILVIDDEEEVLETLKEMLASAGHVVSTAGSGDAGIAAFSQGEIDLVLSDLGMPGMSGWEVVRQIRELDPAVPMVLITGWGEHVDPELLRQSGVVRTVGKPVDMKGLLRSVSEGVRGRSGAGAPASSGTSRC
jgi:PAS domain S-box-containing protein